MRHSISRFGFWLFFALACGSGRPAIAQSTNLSTLKLNYGYGATALVWDPTRSRFFAPSGTNVLMINPETASVEDTIPLAGVANQIAISSDGQYLYASLFGEGRLNRYRIQNHSLDLQIPLSGGNTLLDVQAMVALPGQPSSILVSLSDQQLMIFDNALPRAVTASVNVSSLYVRPSDGAFFGFGGGQVFWLSVSGKGVTLERSVLVDPNSGGGTPSWNGNLLAVGSSILDLNAGATIGRIPLPPSTANNGACVLATDAAGTSAFAFQWAFQLPVTSASLVQYSLVNLRPVASAAVTGLPSDYGSLAGICGLLVATWGPDGIATNDNRDGLIHFLHARGLAAVAPAPIPTPNRDAAGVIHLPLAANGLVFDTGRNVLWASVPGKAAAAGDSVVSIDPSTGNVIDTIFAGREPGALALSGDGSHLFVALAGAPEIVSIDLAAKQTSAFPVSDPAGSLYWTAIGVAAIAGQSNSVVAVRSAQGVHSSVIAYDAGVPRKNTFDNVLNSQYVQAIFPGDAAGTFYATNGGHYGDGTHDVFRLLVNSTGITLDKRLNPLLLGELAAALVYDGARLLTSAGQVLTPDTSRILGSVALTPRDGLPLPFSDHNAVVYVQNASPQVAAVSYDFATLRPLTTVPLVTGPPCLCTSNTINPVNVVAAVRAGSNAVAIAANGEIAIASLGSFQPWPSSTGSLQPVSTGVRKIDLPVNAISVLPGTSKLLLATASTAGSVGNSVVTYNPDTSQIENSSVAGSEPSILASTPDGSSVYVYLSGEYNVARVNVTSGARDLVFAADPTGGTDQYSVFDMAVSPAGGLAVSYPGSGTFAVFDGAKVRPQVEWNSQGAFTTAPATFDITFNDSGTVLYGYNSFLDSFELKRDAVSARGVAWLSTESGLVRRYSSRLRWAQGLLYTSYGDVIDPERSVVVGRFADSWFSGEAFDDVAVDAAGGRAYFVTNSGVLIFDLRSYALVGRLPLNLNSVGGTVWTSLVRFGANGLAFLAPNGRVYLFDISAIPLLSTPVSSPQLPFIAVNGVVPIYGSAPVIQPGSWISIYGVNLADSTATWNGDFPTKLAGTSVMIDYKPAYLWYVSSNQLNVQAPDDSFLGPNVNVQVTTAAGTATATVTTAQFAPSLSLFDSRYVAAEIPTPDGSGAYGGGTYDLAGPTGHFTFRTRPVKSGETLVLYGVGFGPTNPAVPAGKPSTRTAPTTNPVTVTIGGKPATVLFSGIVAAGLYQINVTVPSVPSGDQTLQANVGGVSAPVAIVAVQ